MVHSPFSFALSIWRRTWKGFLRFLVFVSFLWRASGHPSKYRKASIWRGLHSTFVYQHFFCRLFFYSVGCLGSWVPYCRFTTWYKHDTTAAGWASGTGRRGEKAICVFSLIRGVSAICWAFVCLHYSQAMVMIKWVGLHLDACGAILVGTIHKGLGRERGVTGIHSSGS